MDWILWQGILILSGIQMVLSFIVGVFVFQALAYLFKAKIKHWRIAIKLSAAITVLKSVVLIIPYFFLDSIGIRIAIVIAGLVLLIALASYLVKLWYKTSLLKAILISIAFFIIIFLLGFPMGSIIGDLAYSLGIIGVPII